MPSVRLPVARAVLHPSARALPRSTQPLLTQVRAASGYEKSMEPNDGGKRQAQPQEKGQSGTYNLDGTSKASSNSSLMWIGGAAVALGAAYFMFMGKPDTVAKGGIKADPDTVKHQTGSEKQREGGPQRSEK